MTILATKVVPDLLFYIQNYVVNSTANKYMIPYPDTFSYEFLASNRSFIRLLFDDTWPTTYTSYRYLFRLEDCMNSAATTLKTRMMLYPGNSQLYVCDSDSTAECTVNVFGLQQDDLDLLDKLLLFRTDTTSCDITTITYENLTTTISKLIYIYLNFKINNDYTLFDNSVPLSNSLNVLENFYESFIIDTIFKYLSSLGT